MNTFMPKKKPIKMNTFAQQFAELESIVSSFEKNNLDLDESLKQFERGLQLTEQLKKILDTAENRIVELKKKYHSDREA